MKTAVSKNLKLDFILTINSRRMRMPQQMKSLNKDV